MALDDKGQRKTVDLRKAILVFSLASASFPLSPFHASTSSTPDLLCSPDLLSRFSLDRSDPPDLAPNGLFNESLSLSFRSTYPSMVTRLTLRLTAIRAITALVVFLFHSLSVNAQTTTPLMSLSTTLSQSVISSSSTATTSSIPPAPTSNSTASEGGSTGTKTQDLFLWPPQGGLKQCERVTFA